MKKFILVLGASCLLGLWEPKFGTLKDKTTTTNLDIQQLNEDISNQNQNCWITTR